MWIENYGNGLQFCEAWILHCSVFTLYELKMASAGLNEKYNLWWNYILHHTNASINKSAGIHAFINNDMIWTQRNNYLLPRTTISNSHINQIHTLCIQGWVQTCSVLITSNKSLETELWILSICPVFTKPCSTTKSHDFYPLTINQ
jgi:hypothetical protein